MTVDIPEEREWLPGELSPIGTSSPPLLAIQVAPQVHVLVDTSMQVNITVSTAGPAVIQPEALTDAVKTAAEWAARHRRK